MNDVKKCVGIIAEFNPLHKGHMFLIENAKKFGNVIVAMSGGFTQRGDVAIEGKFSRAKSAVDAGADLVIEIPLQFAVAPAEIFARGGLQTLRNFKGLNALIFGSESGDIAELKGLCERAESARKTPEFKEKLRGNLNAGKSFPAAEFEALGEEFSELKKPNNILAVEYIKAAGGSLELLTVKRQGAGFKDLEEKGGFLSAAGIRGRFFAEQIKETEKKLFALLKYKILNSTAVELSEIFDISEGLHNKFIKSAQKAGNFQEFLAFIKTKRYTMAKIKRICIYILLELTKERFERLNKPNEYVNILAYNERERQLLGGFDVPIVTREQDILRYDIKGEAFEFQKTADNLYKSLI